MSNWIQKKEKESKWIQKKKVDAPTKWITKKPEKSNAQTDKETVSDAQKRGKIPLNFKKGGRVNYGSGGKACAQIKGFGKARRPNKR